jgi:hypothetical protein
VVKRHKGGGVAEIWGVRESELCVFALLPDSYCESWVLTCGGMSSNLISSYVEIVSACPASTQ